MQSGLSVFSTALWAVILQRLEDFKVAKLNMVQAHSHFSVFWPKSTSLIFFWSLEFAICLCIPPEISTKANLALPEMPSLACAFITCNVLLPGVGVTASSELFLQCILVSFCCFFISPSSPGSKSESELWRTAGRSGSAVLTHQKRKAQRIGFTPREEAREAPTGSADVDWNSPFFA